MNASKILSSCNTLNKPVAISIIDGIIEVNYFDDTKLHIDIVKSNRRSICIGINKSAKVAVKCGFFTQQKTILQFIQDKSIWILKSYHKVHAKLASQKYYKKCGYKTGDFLYILGNKVYISISINENKSHNKEKYKIEIIDNTLFVVAKSLTMADKMILKFIANLALKYFQEHLNNYFDIFKSKILEIANTTNNSNLANYILNIHQPNLSIGNFANKWGSLHYTKCGLTYTNCNFFGKKFVSKVTNLKIKLALKLFTLNDDDIENNAIRYVIFHELCHIIFQDHSKAFYNLQKNFVPNYAEIKNNLGL